MKVAIIEDELISQKLLVKLLNNLYPNIEIAVILDSVEKSIEWLSLNNVDLIFMDIHLSDDISFRIFDKIEINTPVVFCTAYDKYAMEAFDANGIAYILKPLNKTKIINVMNKVERLKLINDNNQKMEKLLSAINNINKYKQRFSVKLGDRLFVVEVSDIAYFFSENGLCYLITKDNMKLIVENTIETLENLLDPSIFFKITRGCIAQLSSIKNIYKLSYGKLKVELEPPFLGELNVSRERVPEFMKWIDDQ